MRAAIAAGVPIVPTVSIGGQETQLFLTRGAWLAKQLRLKRLRTEILPLGFGLPFGLTSTIPANFPLPSKIVTEVLDPIDVVELFGEDPDIDEVDAHVRGVMQSALEELAPPAVPDVGVNAFRGGPAREVRGRRPRLLSARSVGKTSPTG